MDYIKRPYYLRQLESWKDHDIIKFVFCCFSERDMRVYQSIV